MPPATDWKEIVPDGEAARFEGYAQRLAALAAKHAKPGADPDRALHAKGTGFEGELAVIAGDNPDARVGLFAEPAAYKALVRFSNGSGRRASDKRADVRGIAIKLFGVGGKKLIPGMEDATTQDLLMIRSPATPVRNADEFFALVNAVSSPALAPFKLIGALGLARGIAVLRGALKSLKPVQLPLAATAFYTAVPVSYGPYAAQLALVPHDTSSSGAAAADKASATYLGDGLAARLRTSAVVYDLAVRFWESEATTPIEDASVAWATPLHTIARLTLPVQDAASARGRRVAALVETLAFDPWHARTDLRPLGSMMRARNVAYRASTAARHAAPEPTAYPDF